MLRYLLLALCLATAAFASAPLPPQASPLPPPPSAKPNILIVVGDDWSYPHAGAYGCTWVKTPAFDRVAREGLLFTRAYTPNAKCAPSRTSILLGRNPWQNKEGGNHYNFFPPEFRTYPETLAAKAGYFIGYTGKGWSPGIARTADGKPRSVLGRDFSSKKLQPSTPAISDVDYAANFTDFLDASTGKPWCFWFGSNEPHRDYTYGTGVSVGGKKLDEIPRVPGYWPDHPEVRNDMLDYAHETEHFDRHLGLMLAELEKRGQLDNTLILVTADNGMPFPRAKGNVYEISNHLPLAIRWPAGIAQSGRVIDDYVSFIDYAPTILHAAGLDWADSGMAPASGRSLFDIFRSPASGQVNPARSYVILGQERHDIGRPGDVGYPIRGIVKDNFLYTYTYALDRWPACNPETGYLNCDGGATKTHILNLRRASPTGTDPFWQLNFGKRTDAEALYDLRNDPDCLHNLAADPAHAARVKEMSAQMNGELTAQADPRMFGQGHVFDDYPFASEQHIHYYEKYKAGHMPEASWVNPTDYEKAPLD